MEPIAFHELGVQRGKAIGLYNVMFVYIHTYMGHASIIVTRKNAHRVWKFQPRLGLTDMLPLFSTPVHTRSCNWSTDLAGRTRSLFFFNALLSLQRYLFEVPKQIHACLSVFWGVLKICLEDIIYAALKKSWDCSGAPRSQILQSPGSY